MRDALYERNCQRWIDGHLTARTPPTGMSFAVKLIQYHAELAAGHRQTPCTSFAPRERSDFESFNAWFSLANGDVWSLVDTLHQAQYDRDLERRGALIGAASRAKERYQSWLESGKLAWLPLCWELRRGTERIRCHMVDYLADGILRCEDAPEEVRAVGEKTESGWRYFA